MIIAKIYDGLGNQMFQHAAGRALSLRLGLPLKLDTSWFHARKGVATRNFLLPLFNACAPIATKEECKLLAFRPRSVLEKLLFKRPRKSDCYVREPHFHYWSGFEAISAPAYLKGYWQSEKYFARFRPEIVDDFTFPDLPASATEIQRGIASSNSVAVHIRRGDYATNKTFSEVFGLCSAEYYKKAIHTLMEQTGNTDLRLYLFTDDPSWVKDNFNTHGLASTPVVFPEQTDEPVHDMHLMTLCRHHIIANSSFSWWGAWLSANDGIKIAPARWFKSSDFDTRDLVPETWLKV